MTSPPWLKIVKVSRRNIFLPSVSITFDLEVRISPVGCERTKFEKRNAWVLAWLQSLFILACQQTGMGTSQAATEREIQFQENLYTKFEIARAIIWRARHAAFLACVKKQRFCLLSDLGNTYSPPSGYKYQTTFAQQFLAGLLISVQMK